MHAAPGQSRPKLSPGHHIDMIAGSTMCPTVRACGHPRPSCQQPTRQWPSRKTWAGSCWEWCSQQCRGALGRLPAWPCAPSLTAALPSRSGPAEQALPVRHLTFVYVKGMTAMLILCFCSCRGSAWPSLPSSHACSLANSFKERLILHCWLLVRGCATPHHGLKADAKSVECTR